MDFLIEMSIIPKGSELTKFRVSGNLPVLHASMSDAKYKSLMRLIDVAIPHFGNENDSGKGSGASTPRPPKKEGSEPFDDRRKSFQFGKGKGELVLEDESIHGEHDTQLDGASPDVPVYQRNLELKFTVQKLTGSLYRSDPDGKKPDQLLAELNAEHFGFEFTLRPYDMTAEVSLQKLSVEDHVEESPVAEFKNIVSSETSRSESSDLFHLKFIRINKDSPEFHSKYKGIAMNIDTNVSTINAIVTRRTLLTLLDFILITFTNPDSSAQSDKNKGSPKQEIDQKENKQQTDKINVNVRLSKIAMVLNNDGIRLATLSLTTANVVVFLDSGKMKIGAHLGNFSLVDDVNQGVPESSPLRQLVTVQGDELAHFRYETFSSEDESYPGYDNSIYLRSGSVKVNFVTEPFRKIMDFAVKFGKMQAIFNAARQAAAHQASQIQESIAISELGPR